jgi:hypothetical protein
MVEDGTILFRDRESPLCKAMLAAPGEEQAWNLVDAAGHCFPRVPAYPALLRAHSRHRTGGADAREFLRDEACRGGAPDGASQRSPDGAQACRRVRRAAQRARDERSMSDMPITAGSGECLSVRTAG